MTIKEYMDDGDQLALAEIKKEYDYYQREIMALYDLRDTLLLARRSVVSVVSQINQMSARMRYLDERRHSIACLPTTPYYLKDLIPAKVSTPQKLWYNAECNFKRKPVYVAPVGTIKKNAA